MVLVYIYYKIRVLATLLQKLVKSARSRELACGAKLEYNVSIRIACDVLSISSICYCYKPALSDANVEIKSRLKLLRHAYKLMRVLLLSNTKGFRRNHKRVYSIYVN